MKTLLIYDKNGVVWSVRPGDETVPKGLKAIVVDAPEEYRAVTVNTETGEAIFINEI